jgi:sRNA-binding carbon storage regulator CsrA
MLILKRKQGERVRIGADIGFLAPKDIPIYREELLSEDEQLAAPPKYSD